MRLDENEILRELEDERIDPPEPEPVMYCGDCGEGLYTGDSYYQINGVTYCERCMKDKFEQIVKDD